MSPLLIIKVIVLMLTWHDLFPVVILKSRLVLDGLALQHLDLDSQVVVILSWYVYLFSF